jgi:hypothetical protein
LAGRSRSTFGKRQKEQKRQEKRQEKLARRDQRKANKASGISPYVEDDPTAMPERGLDFDDSLQDEAS